MPRDLLPSTHESPLEATRQIDALCDEFEAELRTDGAIHLEKYMKRIDARWRDTLLEELTFLALERLQESGSVDPEDQLLAANPTLRAELGKLIADGARTIEADSPPSSDVSRKAGGLRIRCPHCHKVFELIVDAPLVEIRCVNCDGRFSFASDAVESAGNPPITQIAHFELLDRLGMGEFGTVWKAKDTILDRIVAIKIPRQEKLDPLSIEKFIREARAAAQLRHPNIIRTHEVGRHEDTLYIVTEYVRGVPLSNLIADERLDMNEAVQIVRKLADALAHAHSQGVIHRDIKPSNILIDDVGEPHLMDFGLAKRKESEITITADGAILGTPAYMSPEQARGEGHRVDGRSDLYSLGVILFQLLTGDLPFRGSLRMLLHKVINDDPPGPRWLDSRIPKDLDTICLKCMEKDRARRYATAGELGSDLTRFLDGRPISARRVGVLGKTWKWARRNRAVASLLSATLATFLVAALISSYLSQRASENAARVTSTLYDSLLQEARLTREVRQQGYGRKVQSLIERARKLPTDQVDNDELRRQFVLTLGDFVAFEPQVLASTEKQFNAITFGAKGELYVGLKNGHVQCYDSANQLISKFVASDNQIDAVKVSKQGDEIIVADHVGKVGVWQFRDGNWVATKTVQVAQQPVRLYLSEYGERAVAIMEKSLIVWDVFANKLIHTWPIDTDWTINNVAFDKSLNRIAAGLANEEADLVGWTLWSLKDGSLQHHEEMPSLGHSYANGIAFSTINDQLAMGFDEELQIYDLTNFERIRLSGLDSIKAVAFSSRHPHLAALDIRGRVSLWNTVVNRQATSLELQEPDLSLNAVAFNRDGTRLAVSNATSIQLWQQTAEERTVLAGHRGGTPCATYSPDGSLLVTGGKDRKAKFWDTTTSQQLKSLDLGDDVQALAFSKDGHLLAAGCTGRKHLPHLKLIDPKRGVVAFEDRVAMGDVYSLCWAHAGDDTYLAGAGDAGVALWKVLPEEPLRLEPVIEHEGNMCLAVVLSSDAKYLVWVEDERRLMAWDMLARREIRLASPDVLHGWHGLSFLPDDQSVIYIAANGVAEIWDIARNQRVKELGKEGTFRAPEIALSADGEWLAALLDQDALSVWYVPQGQHVFSMRPVTGSIWSLAWSAQATQLSVGQSDGGLAVWHLPKIWDQLDTNGLSWHRPTGD